MLTADGHSERVALTVVIVDDHPVFRDVLRSLLAAEGFLVIGEAGDAAGALSAVAELRPDVVVLDVRLPDGSGVDAARVLSSCQDPPLVVLVSTGDYAHAVRGCGAIAFIPKSRLSGNALRQAIGAA